MLSFRTIIIIFLVATTATPAIIPVNTPSSENLYTLARELYGRGLLDDLEYSDLSGVEQRETTGFESGLASTYEQLLSTYLTDFEKPNIRFGLEAVGLDRSTGSENKAYFKLFPKIEIDLRPDLKAAVVYRIDKEVSENPRYDGKYWKGWAGFVEAAIIKFHADRLNFRFGFERISWGFGRYGNLLFSKQALPMTTLGFSYKGEKIRFESLCGFLSPLNEELDGRIDDPDYFTSQQRYLAAHSVTIRPFDDFSVSLREVVVYGGPGRRFEPAYSFPLIWYHGYQLNSRMDDNTLISAGVDYRYTGKFWLYGELMIDDYQIESNSPSDNEPDQIGLLLGGEIYDPGVAGTRISLEYARINNWVYNQPRPHNRYINRNMPIGFPDGSDNDNFNWEVSWWASAAVRVAYFGMYQRVGEGSIDTEWTAPWLDSATYSELFPSGIIRETTQNGVSLLILNKNRFWGKLEIQLSDINNVRNIPGENQADLGFSMEIGCNLPPFGWGL